MMHPNVDLIRFFLCCKKNGHVNESACHNFQYIEKSNLHLFLYFILSIFFALEVRLMILDIVLFVRVIIVLNLI